MILVTGSGGTVGSEVVKELTKLGAPVRAAYRSRPPAAPGVQGARIDLTTGAGLDEALRDVEAVFLLVGEVEDQVAAERRLVDASRRANVKRLVKLSVLDAEGEGYAFARIHRAVERAIESSGIPYTFLRPGSFMQNFATYYRDMIRGGTLYLPLGDAREAHVDARDIAAVAARALTSDAHAGKSYDLVGPEALSYVDAVAQISAATGRTIAYVPVSDDDYARQWRAWACRRRASSRCWTCTATSAPASSPARAPRSATSPAASRSASISLSAIMRIRGRRERPDVAERARARVLGDARYRIARSALRARRVTARPCGSPRAAS